MGALKVELVAADRKVWEGEATMVVARAEDGDLGILPGHAPLMATLRAGEVRIDVSQGERQVVTVDEGFLTVENDHVIIAAHTVEGTPAA